MLLHPRQRSAGVARGARFSALLAASLLVSSAADAQQPFFDYGTHSSAEDAFDLQDTSISRVLYAELGCPGAPVWQTFEGEKGQSLFVRLGMPALAPLAGERPSLALLGPGLPAARALPFPVPAGLGAQVFSTTGVRRPWLIRAPRTDRASWLLLEMRIELPEKGKYYLVAWSPRYHRTRLWVATGEEEVPAGWSNVDDPEDRLKLLFDALSAPDLGAPCPPRR